MNAGTYHPLRGSEDEQSYTRQQRETLSSFFEQHDEVRHKLLPDGNVSVEAIDYEESGHRVECHVITKGGVPF